MKVSSKTIQTASCYANLGNALLDTVAADIQKQDTVEMDDETRERIIMCLRAAVELVEKAK